MVLYPNIDYLLLFLDFVGILSASKPPHEVMPQSELLTFLTAWQEVRKTDSTCKPTPAPHMCIYVYNIHGMYHTEIHTYVHTHIHHTYIYIYIHTYIHTHIHTYTHTHIHTYTHTHIHTYTHIHTHTHTYTHIHTYTHTHIHTYIHTYMAYRVWLEFDFNSGFKSIVILKGWLSKTGFWARVKIDFQPLWFQFLGASTD